MSGEAASTNEAAAKAYPDQLKRIIEKKGYLPEQVFNCDETGLFWKKMPSRTFISKEEKRAPGFKVAKDRITLVMCGNAAGHMIKNGLSYRSANPQVLKGKNKNLLPVYWQSNKKACVTAVMFLEWFYKCFVPEVEKYLKAKGMEFKVLLIVDNAPCHPPSIKFAHPNVEVVFLPPNTTSLIQPLDQGVIKVFKANYTRWAFSAIREAMDVDNELSLITCWKAYTIADAITNISDAMQDLKPESINACWRNLWPEVVNEFTGFPTIDNEVRQIVAIARQFGGEGFADLVDREVEELIEEHREELTDSELQEMAHTTEEEDREESNDDAESHQGWTLEAFVSVFRKVQEAMDEIVKRDDSMERSLRIVQGMKDLISPYREMFNDMKRRGKRLPITLFIQRHSDPQPSISSTQRPAPPPSPPSDASSNNFDDPPADYLGSKEGMKPHPYPISSNNLTHHSLIHKGMEPFPCGLCGKHFYQEWLLIKHHSLMHTERDPNSCSICGKHFTEKLHLTKHSLVHTTRTCRVCGKVFIYKKDLTKHSLIHKGIELYSCKRCGKHFTQKLHLTKHSLVHTSRTCRVCGKVFIDKKDLINHSLIHKWIEPYSCRICGKHFTEKLHLTKHSLVHTSRTCRVCGKVFIYKKDLTNHSLIHKGIELHSCSICGKHFTQKLHLTKHSLVHTTYSCGGCGKRFTDKKLLTTHYRTHQTFYPCIICGLRYVTMVDLMAHHCMDQEMDPYTLSFDSKPFCTLKPYSCTICGKRFTRKVNFTIHSVKHKGITVNSRSIVGKKTQKEDILAEFDYINVEPGLENTDLIERNHDIDDSVEPGLENTDLIERNHDIDDSTLDDCDVIKEEHDIDMTDIVKEEHDIDDFDVINAEHDIDDSTLDDCDVIKKEHDIDMTDIVKEEYDIDMTDIVKEEHDIDD